MILFSILWNDILPLFVFIGAGWFLDSKFKIDISTYSKLTILVVLPCFIFYSLYGYRGSGMEMAAVAAAVLLKPQVGRTCRSMTTHSICRSVFRNAVTVSITMVMA